MRKSTFRLQATEVRPRANFDVITVENLEKAPQLRVRATSAKESSVSNYFHLQMLNGADVDIRML